MYTAVFAASVTLVLYGAIVALPEHLTAWIPAFVDTGSAEAIATLFAIIPVDLKAAGYDVDVAVAIVGFVLARLPAAEFPSIRSKLPLISILVLGYLVFAYASTGDSLTRYSVVLGKADFASFKQFLGTARTLFAGLLIGILSRRPQPVEPKPQDNQNTETSPAEHLPSVAKPLLIGVVAGLLATAPYLHNSASAADFAFKATIHYSPASEIRVYGQTGPGTESKELTDPTGKIEWQVSVPTIGANPILSFEFQNKRKTPGGAQVDAKTIIVLPLYFAPDGDVSEQISVQAITDDDIALASLDKLERLGVSIDHVDRFRRVFAGQQILAVYAEAGMRSEYKARAAQVAYNGAWNLYQTASPAKIQYLPTRDLLDSHSGFLPVADKAKVEAKRSDSFWFLVRSTGEPGIIKDEKLVEAFKPCAERLDWQFDTRKVDGSTIRIPQAPDQTSEANKEAVSGCMKRVRDQVCPDAKKRLSRVGFLFSSHLMKEEIRAVYDSRVVAGEKDLIVDARARYREICDDKDAFADLLSWRQTAAR